jgi:hypothetical protein
MVERARIVLAAADGIGTNEIARQLLTRPAREQVADAFRP